MGLKTLDMLVGQSDINKQFDEGSLRQNLANFDTIYQNGDYDFGALTALFFDLKKHPHEYATWIQDATNYANADVRRVLKETVIASLRNTKNGNPHPIPINWLWTTDPNDPKRKDVVVTPPDQSSPHYIINIIGWPAPPQSLIAQRREKRNGK